MTTLTENTASKNPGTLSLSGCQQDASTVSTLIAERGKIGCDGTLGFLGVGMVFMDAALFFTLLVWMNWLRAPKDAPESLLFFLLPMAVLGLCLFLIDGYRVRPGHRTTNYAMQHVLTVGIAMVLTLFVSYVVFHQWATATARRGNLAISFLAFIPFSLYYRKIFAKKAVDIAKRSAVFFLGDRDGAIRFQQESAKHPEIGEVVYVADQSRGQVSDSVAGPQLQPLDLELFKKHEGKINAVVCAEDVHQYPESIVQLLLNFRLSAIPVFTVESYYEARFRKIPADTISPAWLFKEGFRIAHDPVYLHIKRLSDLVLAGIGLLFTAPLFLLVSIGVKLTDPRGPVFFKQPRIGLNNKTFTVYKFRSMKVGSEKGDRYTQDDDPRFTPIGKFLRKSRLDELPQLWNVLKGDMSLIGPRAEWDKLVAEYEQKIPYYHFRHLVKPGITGWAQVNYPYGANLADTIEKLEYDLYYIRHFSFILDASIVLKTIHTMLFGEGGR